MQFRNIYDFECKLKLLIESIISVGSLFNFSDIHINILETKSRLQEVISDNAWNLKAIMVMAKYILLPCDLNHIYYRKYKLIFYQQISNQLIAEVFVDKNDKNNKWYFIVLKSKSFNGLKLRYKPENSIISIILLMEKLCVYVKNLQKNFVISIIANLISLKVTRLGHIIDNTNM